MSRGRYTLGVADMTHQRHILHMFRRIAAHGGWHECASLSAVERASYRQRCDTTSPARLIREDVTHDHWTHTESSDDAECRTRAKSHLTHGPRYLHLGCVVCRPHNLGDMNIRVSDGESAQTEDNLVRSDVLLKCRRCVV